MDNIIVGGEQIAIDLRVHGRGDREWISIFASRFLRGRNREPANGRSDPLNGRDGDLHVFVDGVGPRIVQPWSQQGFFAFADRFAESNDNSALLGAHSKQTGSQEEADQEQHDKFDYTEAAAQGFGERLRACIDGRLRQPRVFLGMWSYGHSLFNKISGDSAE